MTDFAEPGLDTSRFNVEYDDSAAPRPTSYATAEAPSPHGLTQSLANIDSLSGAAPPPVAAPPAPAGPKPEPAHDMGSLSGLENSVGESAPPEMVEHVQRSLEYANAAREAADNHLNWGLGRDNALAQAIDIRNDAIKAATGIDLENPLRGGYSEDARIKAASMPTDPADAGSMAQVEAHIKDIAGQIYQQKLNELATKNKDDPAMLAAIGADRPISQDAIGVTNYADYAAQTAYAKTGGGVLPIAAGIGGELVSGLRDPISDLALIVGPGESAAKSLVGKVVDTAVKYGLISGGITAASEPFNQQWNAELGREHGFYPAVQDVADSMLAGFIGSAGIHGTKIAIQHLFGGGATRKAIDDFIAQVEKTKGIDSGTAQGRAWRQEIDDFLQQQEAAKGPQLAIAGPREEGAAAPEGVAAAAPPAVAGEPTQLPGAVQEPTPEGATVPPQPVNGAPVPAPETPHVSRETPAVAPAPVASALDAIDRTRLEMAETDAAVAPPRLPGADPHDMLAAYGDAVRHGEDPERSPPPLPAVVAPHATEPPVIAPDTPYQPTPGYSFEKNGRPITFGSFDVANIGTDATTMQYKGGGDASGVTDRLQGVKQWDPMASGKTVLYQREDGSVVVADGHQRLGLAKRLSGGGASGAPIKLDGYLLKASDGWTPQEARAIAAKKNIMEGSGDALDTARVLRESPEIWDDSLPVTDGKLKQARGLADLSDPAWGMALNGLVPPNYAALVGRAMPDKSKHIAVMGDLAKFKPANENEARLMIADANAAGFATEVQQSLFGMEEATRSLVRERGQVYSAALDILRTDRKVFATLDREAARIEAEGNVLVASNASRADRAGQLGQMLETLATRSGPVSAALNRAAAEVADKSATPKQAARQFVDNLMDLIQQEGVKIIPDAMEPVVPAPAMKAETPAERALQTQTLEANAAAEPQGIYDDVLEKLRNAGLPEDQALANAAVVAARYETRALRLGLEADEARDLYRGEGLQIRRTEPEVEGQGLMFAQAGREFDQPVTVPPFYSAVSRAVKNAKQAKASPEQWLATIRNTAGVKPEELSWLGIEDWLKSQDGPVTRDQVADFVRANAIDVQEIMHGAPVISADDSARLSKLEDDFRAARQLTPDERQELYSLRERSHQGYAKAKATEPKYGSYVLPGGQNYRELLLTLPEKPGAEVGPRGWGDTAGGTSDSLNYRSAHWEEPNVLAHIRFDDRTIDGQKVLHVAEVQSDWGQALRKSGALRKVSEPYSVGKLGEDFFGRKLVPSVPLNEVDAGMLALAHHDQVARSIVSLLPADVVDKFGGQEGAAKQLSRDAPMFFNLLPADRRSLVAKMVVDNARQVLTEARAKLADGFETGRDVEILPALRASQLTAREVVGMLSPKSLYHMGLSAKAVRADIAFRRAEETARGGSAQGNREGLAATDTEFLDRPLAAGDRAIPRPGSSTRPDVKSRAATVAEALDWHNRILGESGISQPVRYQATDLPSMPFGTSWPELSMKRVLRYAAEHGYDRVTWDTGATNADRYDLSKHISSIALNDNVSGSGMINANMEGDFHGGTVIARDHTGQVVVDKYINDAQQLADTIGKEAAEKLLQGKAASVRTRGGLQARQRTIEGLDLKVGGEGMTGFYDKILPAAVNKLVKKFGAKVDRTSVPTATGSEGEAIDDAAKTQYGPQIARIMQQIDDAQEAGDEAREQELWAQRAALAKQAEQETAARRAGVPVHSLTLTPALKDAAMQEGFALFHGGQAEPRGRITLLDNRAIVHLFEQANASTFMHEAGHLWLDELARDARRDDAPAGVKEDLDTVLKWLGADKAEDIGREGHEQWSTSFERYLAEGAAPSERLAGIFEKFKLWLRQIYARLLDIAKPIPKEIRGVFDRMLATDEEIAARSGKVAPIQTLEQFAKEKGLVTTADVDSHIHAGLRSAPQTKTYARSNKAKLEELQGKRDETVAAYREAIAKGEIREPTRIEKLRAAAAGHEDNAATHAARRLLAKEGVEAETGDSPQKIAMRERFAHMQAIVAERKATAKEMAAAGEPVRLAHADGRTALAGPDMSKPGAFRLTRFDGEGPVGHTEAKTLAAAVEDGLKEGYQPGAVHPKAIEQTVVATHASRADLLAKIDAGATPEELEAHPMIAGAKHALTQIPKTDLAKGYLSPAWKKNRLFNFDGAEVKGYPAAITRLLALARAYSTDGPVRQERRAYIVIGPPAAGKSTLSEHIARLEHAAIVDNDDAKKVLPEFAGGLGANAVHEESTDLSREVLKKAAANGDNIVIPKIGQNTNGIGMLIDALRAAGYEVHLANLHVSPEIAFGRMIRRFINTGRLIDPGYFHSIGDKPQQTFAALSGDERITSHADIDGEGPIHEPARVVSGAGRIADLFGGVAGPRRAGADQIHSGAPGSGGGAAGEGGQGGGAGGQVTVAEIADQIAQLTPEEIKAGVEKIAAEAGAEGFLQNLIPGVAPVTNAERMSVQAAKPLRGGNTPLPAGGLFDDAATQQMDLLTMMRQAQRAPRKAASLWDAVPMAESDDGKDMVPVDRQALLDQVPMQTALAKFVDDCQI